MTSECLLLVPFQPPPPPELFMLGSSVTCRVVGPSKHLPTFLGRGRLPESRLSEIQFNSIDFLSQMHAQQIFFGFKK